MFDLTNLRVAVLASDGFEEQELTEPVKALKDAGARVDVISTKSGRIQAFKHMTPTITVPVDKTLDGIATGDYDAVLLPGGALNADFLRAELRALQFIASLFNAGKPFAVICHAPWELISAGVAAGRRMTSYHTIQDDLRNAGVSWTDEEVVVDGNLITSRQPEDIPAFNAKMLELFSQSMKQTTVAA